MNIKSFTDLGQSKKLSEILPLDSADHCFLNDGTAIKAEINSYNVALQLWKDHYVEIIPAWSLAALLNVLPQTVRLVGTSKDSYWYCECVNANNQWYVGFESASNPVDAAYKMIIKLKEDGIL